MGITHAKDKPDVKRDAKGLWLGSGNPRGKQPKPYPEYIEIARNASTEAIMMFLKCMREADDWETRCRAGVEILNRAYGKPQENKSIDVSTNNGPLVVGAAPISQELWAEAIGLIEQRRSIEQQQNDAISADADTGADNLATTAGTADILDLVSGP